jgi:tetratricopeptide (TPR) repeat protein
MIAPARLSPEEIKNLLLQAHACHVEQRWEMVEKICLEILACEVRQPFALFLLGVSSARRGNPEAAVRMMRRAIQAKEEIPLFHAQLGRTLLDLKQFEDAGRCFQRALELDPNQIDALFGMAGLHWQREEIEQNEQCLLRVAALQPEHAEAWNNLGATHVKQGRIDAAIGSFQRAVALQPRCALFLTGLGNALHLAGRIDESVAALKQALEIDPHFVLAHQILGSACFDQGDLESSLRYNLSALALQPDHPPTRFDLCLHHLLLGDYANGWREYEIRWQVFPPRRFPQPLWEGQDLRGKTILLHAEQGLGDTLQFLRYLPLVLETGAAVLLDLSPRLRRLAMELPGPAAVFNTGDALPPFDYHTPLLSLPLRFGTTLETIPAQVPYLRAPAAAREKAASLAWPDGGLRVGLNWAGSPTRHRDVARSLALAQLEPLFDLPGVHLFSLQMGPQAEQLEPYRERITDLAPATSDMADTAAQMEHLDLVISVDTAVAHMAGALGKPFWVLLSYLPDWRWLLNRPDSPWYPSARLFRQPRRGDWSAVVDAVRRALAERAAHSST